MTQTTKEIFEKHEVRKTKAEKSAFIDFAIKSAEDMGYSARVERGELGARNIVVGDPTGARAVFTAHYDTAPRLPFPNLITPRSILLYVLYQIAIMLLLFAIPAVIVGVLIFALEGFGVPKTVTGELYRLAYVLIFIEILLMMIGPANKHTANDNTSGVTLLFDIMRDIPEKKRDRVAFIFFDLEEVGLVGSSSYAAKHKNEMKEKLVINFDCVSDGKNILFALRRGAESYRGLLEEAYSSEGDYVTEFHSKGVIYPSDQMSFPKGVGVSALNKTKRGLLYMDKIHTSKDTVYDEANIEFLKERSVILTELLVGEGSTPSDNGGSMPEDGKIDLSG